MNSITWGSNDPNARKRMELIEVCAHEVRMIQKSFRQGLLEKFIAMTKYNGQELKPQRNVPEVMKTNSTANEAQQQEEEYSYYEESGDEHVDVLSYSESPEPAFRSEAPEVDRGQVMIDKHRERVANLNDGIGLDEIEQELNMIQADRGHN